MGKDSQFGPLCLPRQHPSNLASSRGIPFHKPDLDLILPRSTAMQVFCRFRLSSVFRFATSCATVALILASVVLTCSQPANALPAFARKYGLRCSACHESWPMLNYFGQKFKDNGYQLMNDRDAPIWQNPGYWPVTFRITPIWHRVSTARCRLTPMRRMGRRVRVDRIADPARHELRLRPERPRLPHRRHARKKFLVLRAAVFRLHGLFPL